MGEFHMSKDKNIGEGWNEFYKNYREASQEARRLETLSEDEYQSLEKRRPHLPMCMTSYYSDNWPGEHQFLSNNKTQK
jgi:hypothetical protein